MEVGELWRWESLGGGGAWRRGGGVGQGEVVGRGEQVRRMWEGSKRDAPFLKQRTDNKQRTKWGAQSFTPVTFTVGE